MSLRRSIALGRPITIWRLVFKEIMYRKLNFALGLSSVVVAAACLVGAMTLLRAHDLRTEEMMREMEDDYRKTMKKLGFNVLILPKGHKAEFWAEDFASRYMPEEYAERLADSSIMSVRHLLPSLSQKVKWPERKRTVILMGVRGEVPLVHRRPREAMVEPVPPGGMVVGYELHRSLGLSAGDTCKLLGREFTVTKLHPERGSKDDITIWINLGEAQELLDREGLINGILALGCYCAAARPGQVRSEITRILPDTDVMEFATRVLVRAEARRTAAAARESLRAEREATGAVLVPLVIAACAVWVGLLAFGNVRDRRSEIGVLRALGLRSRHVLTIFLAKASLTGLLGASVGYLVGWLGCWGIGALSAAAEGEGLAGWRGAGLLFDPVLLVMTLLVAPLLSALAAWLPAVIAAQQDPAVVLAQE